MDNKSLIELYEQQVEGALRALGGSVPADQSAEMMMQFYHVGQRHMLKRMQPLKQTSYDDLPYKALSYLIKSMRGHEFVEGDPDFEAVSNWIMNNEKEKSQ